jgi:hypothetical protein
MHDGIADFGRMGTWEEMMTASPLDRLLFRVAA